MRRRLLVGLAWEWLRGRGFGGLAPPRPEAEEARAQQTEKEVATVDWVSLWPQEEKGKR